MVIQYVRGRQFDPRGRSELAITAMIAMIAMMAMMAMIAMITMIDALVCFVNRSISGEMPRCLDVLYGERQKSEPSRTWN